MKIPPVALGACLLVSCSGESTPTDPIVNPLSGGVATVEVSSTRGALLDVGGTMSLQARALDSDGQPVAASFTWAVEDAAVAQVDEAARWRPWRVAAPR